MKKIILICCSLIMLSACDNNNKTSNIVLVNSYLYYGGVENAPYSKPIKKQTILGSEHKLMQSNTNGLITLVETSDLKLEIDYESKKSLFIQDGEVIFDFDVEFDEHNNMIKQQDMDKNMSWISTFDDKGRIIKIERITNPVFISHIMTFAYENNIVSKTVNETIYHHEDRQALMFKKNKQYFYNEDNQITKIVIDSRQYNAFSQNEDEQLLTQQTTECSFYDYNQYGDWTKSYCLIPEQNPPHFVLRELEY